MTALERAAEIPIRIAEAGSDLACLGALLVQNGNPEVRADAAIACVLAEGGTRAAAKLVETNLGATLDDPRVRHVRTLVGVATGSVRTRAGCGGVASTNGTTRVRAAATA